MELKEYLNIIKKNITIFISTVVGIIIISLGYFYFLPARYDASLTLNITRAGSQETSDYKYDDFYRLQADERFAETLVEWIKSPRVKSDIFSQAGESLNFENLSKYLSAERRSSQMVAVVFSSATSVQAQKIADGIVSVIKRNTAELNNNQKENTWFEIVSADPVIEKYAPDYKIIFLASLFFGIFLAFWVVLIKHYLE